MFELAKVFSAAALKQNRIIDFFNVIIYDKKTQEAFLLQQIDLFAKINIIGLKRRVFDAPFEIMQHEQMHIYKNVVKTFKT